MKCHLSCFQIFSFMPESAYRKCEGNVFEMSCVLTTGNVLEMSCVLTTGNVPEILPYTAAPGKAKEMSKFPGVGNVQEM